MAAAYLLGPDLFVGRQVCGKKAYHNRQSAMRKLRNIKPPHVALTEVGVGFLNAYLCRNCNTWHVGHTMRRIEAKKRNQTEQNNRSQIQPNE